MQPIPLEVVVLAAGKGTRMRSSLPKVLHLLGGKPLLGHVLDTARALDPQAIHVVVGHHGKQVKAAGFDGVQWVEQAEQNGTGHAVMQALPMVGDRALVLVLYGDVPLVALDTLRACVAAAAETDSVALVTADFDDPGQLGRIKRRGGSPDGPIERIVEYPDASEEERRIREINSGILCAPVALLRGVLGGLEPKNAQGEYYLTDVIEATATAGGTVTGLKAGRPEEVVGINDRIELAGIERVYQRERANELMRAGVTFADPARVDVRGDVSIGPDTFVDVNVVLEGPVVVGTGAHLGPGAVIVNTTIGDGTQVLAHTVIDGAQIGPGCSVGPFARIRPGSVLEADVKVGNFVEVKKARLCRGAKASHLSYLGDAEVGEETNIGAGTVTCNYDGVNKHRTEIGANAFVGTNSTLVAPLVIGDGAYVGAGSTVTSRVGPGELAVGRARQRNIQGWVSPKKRAGQPEPPAAPARRRKTST